MTASGACVDMHIRAKSTKSLPILEIDFNVGQFEIPMVQYENDSIEWVRQKLEESKGQVMVEQNKYKKLFETCTAQKLMRAIQIQKLKSIKVKIDILELKQNEN